MSEQQPKHRFVVRSRRGSPVYPFGRTSGKPLYYAHNSSEKTVTARDWKEAARKIYRFWTRNSPKTRVHILKVWSRPDDPRMSELVWIAPSKLEQ